MESRRVPILSASALILGSATAKLPAGTIPAIATTSCLVELATILDVQPGQEKTPRGRLELSDGRDDAYFSDVAPCLAYLLAITYLLV